MDPTQFLRCKWLVSALFGKIDTWNVLTMNRLSYVGNTMVMSNLTFNVTVKVKSTTECHGNEMYLEAVETTCKNEVPMS